MRLPWIRISIAALGALMIMVSGAAESSPTTAVVPTLDDRAGGLAVIGTF